MTEFIEIIQTIIALLLPIALYILAGYYAANEKWCYRKIIVAVVSGLCIGGYALLYGIEVTETWVQVVFASAPVMGAMYLIDRLVKGYAKRHGIDWLYTDDCEVFE